MVFKRGAMIVCDIAVAKSVDGIIPTTLDFMLLGSVILALSTFQLTMTIGNFQGIIMVLQLSLEPLKEAEQSPLINVVWMFLK